MSFINPPKEFDRQLSNLLQKGYPKAANLSETEFITLVTPLKKKLPELKLPETDHEYGTLPFVLVVQSNLVAVETMMTKVEWNGKNGLTKLFPQQPTDFITQDFVKVPPGDVYLLIDIDRGQEFLNVRPEKALQEIQAKKRSPLTIDEGIALITQFPEFLIKNNCFSLLASRVPGNQRVPAIWINADKQSNLGWCWNGNPHSWLGSASAKERTGLA